MIQRPTHCDRCGKQCRPERFLWQWLCEECLAEEEAYTKASEDAHEAFEREFGS